MTIQFETTMEREEGDIKVSVTAYVENYAASVTSRGAYGDAGNGVMNVEIKSVTSESGQRVYPTSRELDHLLELAIENHKQDPADLFCDDSRDDE